MSDKVFYSNFLSLLRVDSKITSLVKHRREIEKDSTSRNVKKTHSLQPLFTKPSEHSQTTRLMLIDQKYSAAEQKAIGFSKVNRNSYRLTNASMLNGSNARLLENRFFQKQQSPRGTKLKIYSARKVSNKTTIGFANQILKMDESAQHIATDALQLLQFESPLTYSINTSKLQLTQRPGDNRVTNDLFILQAPDEDQRHALNKTELATSPSNALADEASSLQTNSIFGHVSQARRSSLPSIAIAQDTSQSSNVFFETQRKQISLGMSTASNAVTFDRNNALKLVPNEPRHSSNAAHFAPRSKSVLLAKDKHLRENSSKEQCIEGRQKQGREARLFSKDSFGRGTLRQSPSGMQRQLPDPKTSLAERKSSLVGRLHDQIVQESSKVHKRVLDSVIAMQLLDEQERNRVVLTPGQRFEQEWRQTLLSAEDNVQKAMQSIEQATVIDSNYDLVPQLTKAYKNKLQIASSYLLDQILDQRQEVRMNVNVLETQHIFNKNNPDAEIKFIGAKKAYLAQAQLLKKEQKALKLADKQKTRQTEVPSEKGSPAMQVAESTALEKDSSFVAQRTETELPAIPRFKKKVTLKSLASESGSAEATPIQADTKPHVEEVVDGIKDARVTQEQSNNERAMTMAPLSTITATVSHAKRTNLDKSDQTIQPWSKPFEKDLILPHKDSKLLQVAEPEREQASILKGKLSSLFEKRADKSHVRTKRFALSRQTALNKDLMLLDKEKRISVREKSPEDVKDNEKGASVPRENFSDRLNAQYNSQLKNQSNFIKIDLSRQKLKSIDQSETSSFASDNVQMKRDSSRSADLTVEDDGEVGAIKVSNSSDFSSGKINENVTSRQKISSSDSYSEGTSNISDETFALQKAHSISLGWQTQFVEKQKDLAKRTDPFEAASANYQMESKSVSDFLDFCRSANINGYPILHQVFYGRLVFMNCDFGHRWPKLVRRVIQVAKESELGSESLSLVYFENCRLSDKDFVAAIEALSQWSKLREVHIVKMRILTLTVESLLKLLKMRNGVTISFRETTFADLYHSGPSFEDFQPLLSVQFFPIKHLCLAAAQLESKHLEMIAARLGHLKFLDISHNRFGADSVLNFLSQIARVPKNELKLRSLNLEGNSLKTTSERGLGLALAKLIIKPSLVHLNLSLTNLAPAVVSKIATALKYAQSLQSLHLGCSDESEATTCKHLLKEGLGPFAFMRPFEEDSSSILSHRGEIPANWNSQTGIPDLKTDLLREKVVQSINGSAPLAQSLHKIVVSRVLGRSKDLSLLLRTDQALTLEGTKIDLASLMDEEQQLEIARGNSSVHDYAWQVSASCWVCERWSYCLPLVTKEEIEGCADDIASLQGSLTKLLPNQERVFEAIVKLNGGPSCLEELTIGVPYIVGALTNHKFEAMLNFGDYMFDIDPDAAQVRQKHKLGKFTSIDKHVAYCQVWQRVLRNSSMQPEHAVTNMRQPQLTTAPYEVVINRKQEEVFGKYASVWVRPLLVAPGSSSFFVYYRFDENTALRAKTTFQVPIRSHKTHYSALAKPKKLPEGLIVTKPKQKHKENLIDGFFTLFRRWQSLSDEQARRFVLGIDCEHWQALRKHPRIKSQLLSVEPEQFPSQRLNIKEQRLQIDQVIMRVEEALRDHLPLLDNVWRYLQAQSDSYPAVKYKTVAEFIQHIDFTDDDYSQFQLKLDFIETATSEKTFITKQNIEELDQITGRLHFNVHQVQTKGATVIKAVNNFRTTSMIQKQASVDRDKYVGYEPKNLFQRLHFFEFVARISIHKYAELKPAQAVKRFVKEHLRAKLKTKELSDAIEPQQVLKQLFFSNFEVKKLFFLNQFSLKLVFDALVKSDPSNDSLVAETSASQLKAAMADESDAENSFFNFEVEARHRRASEKSGTIEKSDKEKKRTFSLLIPGPNETQSNQKQRHTFKKLHSVVRHHDLSPLIAHGHSPSLASVQKSRLRRLHGVFNSKVPRNSLPNANHQKKPKDKTVTVYKGEITKLSYSHLQASLVKAVPPELRRLLSNPGIFRKCHAWAKIQTPLVPQSLHVTVIPLQGVRSYKKPSIIKMLEAHSQQAMRLDFVEVCIFLCLLAWQLYDVTSPLTNRRQFTLENARLQALEALTKLFESILGAYGHQLVRDLDDRTLASMNNDFRNNMSELAADIDVELTFENYLTELSEMASVAGQL